MASPASDLLLLHDNESDYGSDFTAEEEQIVADLLTARVLEDDNPIVNEVEHIDQGSILKLPRIFGQYTLSPLFQAIRAADTVAEEINNSFEVDPSLDRKCCLILVHASTSN